MIERRPRIFVSFVVPELTSPEGEAQAGSLAARSSSFFEREITTARRGKP
jgi:hypothetical protein